LKEKEFTSVQSLTDPRKGLEIFKEGNIDLVLLDLKMPFLSGFDFMKSIRGRKDDLPLPVLILTVISYQEAISRSFDGHDCGMLVIGSRRNGGSLFLLGDEGPRSCDSGSWLPSLPYPLSREQFTARLLLSTFFLPRSNVAKPQYFTHEFPAQQRSESRS